MAKIQFLGRVFPEIMKVTLPPRDALWQDPTVQGITTIRLRIVQAIINVECESNIYSMDNIHQLYMRVFDLVRASVNVVAFASGEGLSVILDIVIGEDGIPMPVSPRDKSLVPLCTAFQLNNPDQSVFNEVYDIILGDHGLYTALNDLVLSITVPHVAPMMCGRAMDGLKNLLSAPGTKPPAAWATMQEILRIDKKFRQFITTTSARPRHAHLDHIRGDVIREIWRRSWIIMDRYLQYRKRGSQPLPLAEFPLLTDNE